MKPRIAVTMGDPAGVGPELIARILRDYPEWARKDLHHWVKGLGGNPWRAEFSVEFKPTSGMKSCPLGEPTVEGAAAALEAMEIAAKGCRADFFKSSCNGADQQTLVPASRHETPGAD